MNDIKAGDGFLRITPHLYKVESQDGLYNALYDFFEVGQEGSYSKEEVLEMIDHKSNEAPYFPISFVVVDMSFELNWVILEFFDLKEVASLGNER